jgi:hypothetical protein
MLADGNTRQETSRTRKTENVRNRRTLRCPEQARLRSQSGRGDERGPVSSGPGRRRGAFRARRRARAPAAFDHRPVDRSAAPVQRGRLGRSRVQRRDLQLPGTRPELEALGHVFHTRSDTEVIVHAWEAWGEDCVQRFRGMFAFALYDRNRETLFMARDRLGVKPLFYAVLADATVAFGSELKVLMQVPAWTGASIRARSRNTSRSATWPSRAPSSGRQKARPAARR